MKNKDEMRKLIIEEPKKKVVREDLARGIPDFAFQEAARDSAEGLRRHIQRYILLNAKDPKTQRQMISSAVIMLKEVEDEIRQMLEDKMQDFLRTM